MKQLRGRPRNISESGIIYLDSEGEDSDYSDSDVEPVFFPAAGFGEVLDFEIQEVVESEDDDDSDDSMFEIIRNDFIEHSEILLDNPTPIAAGSGNNSNNLNENQEVVIHFLGGTVQVRHIVNENFMQLQEQQQAQNHSQSSATPQQSSPPMDPLAAAISNNNLDVPEPVAIEIRPVQPLTAEVTGCGDDGNRPLPIIQNVTDGGDQVDPKPSSTIPPKNSAEKDVTSDSTPSSSSARLVPYQESQGIENAKSTSSSNQQVQPKLNSSKRKDISSDSSDEEDNGDNGGIKGKKKYTQRFGGPKRTPVAYSRNNSSGDEDDEEETCNPMVSEDEEETEEAYRGDRIGNTVYSERHVLKILMEWVESLPQYSTDKLILAREKEKLPEEVIEKEILQLKQEFEEQMALLWDMSAEPDVMKFLVEHKVFTIIRDTVDNAVCSRLIEVSLGILANVISEPSIIEDFTVHDSSLYIVGKVVELCSKVTDVAVLIQTFSVLRRITWYLRNVCLMKKWVDLLVDPNFLKCTNFIMSSSTNALLLGNVIMLYFTLLDALNPDGDDEEDNERADGEDVYSSTSTNDNTHNDEAKNKAKLQRLAENYEPFCKSEFVPALCEGLKELMKNPKPKNRRKFTGTREHQPMPSSSGCQTGEHCLTADEIDVPIPDGHVQQAILKGFSTLALLQKATNGQNSLKFNANLIITTLLDFYRIFSICSEATTRSNSLEYFTLSLHLLGICHCHVDAVNMEAISSPVAAASKLISQEERDREADVIRVQLKDGIEFDSVSYIALVVHEYLATVADKFGPDCALEARSNENHTKMFSVLDRVIAKFEDGKKGEND